MSQRLTDKSVKALKPPERGARITYDSQVVGFGVRVTANSAKSYVLNYRFLGRERRITIAPCGVLGLIAAREEARRLKGMVHLGTDPLEERQVEAEAPTVRDLVEVYRERNLGDRCRKAESTKRDYGKILDDHVLPRLGHLKVYGVRPADVERLHQDLGDRPHRANRTVAVCSVLFNLAVRLEWRDTNPCRGIKKYPEEARDRHLSLEELRRLVEVLDILGSQQAANAVRLLILTGARRGEVLGMRWRDLDLEAGLWRKSASSTKQRRSHVVPLSGPAVAILRGMKPGATTEWVFAGKGGRGPRHDLRYWWPKILEESGIEGLRLHDLRHSYASFLASQGLGLAIIGRLLGHSQPQTTARYSHFFEDPLREATERVGEVFREAGASKDE